MDDTHVPVNSPVESHTDHSVNSPASHSRDWVKSVQVKSEQLQQRSPKDYSEGQEILKHNDSSDSLVDAVAATGLLDTRSAEMCIGHSAISKPRHGLSDGMQSEMAENVTKAAPIDNERLEFTSSVPDCDNDHDENGTLVSIVYSKHDDPKNYVLVLAQLLNSLGYNCDIDQYHSSDRHVSSYWEAWIEKVIRKTAEQNGSILYVCSPTLHQACCSMSSSRIEMKFGHINNQALCSLIVDEAVSSHVIPIFLEQYDKSCIPSCLLRTHAYEVNISKAFEVFEGHMAKPDEETDIDSLLKNMPELESFRSLLYKLSSAQEVIKPCKFAALPGLHTSIDSQQMEQLQNNKFPSSQTYFVHTPSTVCTPSHASQQCWVQPSHGHSPHNSCQICLQQRDCQYHHFDQEHAYTPSSNFQHAPSHHPVIYTDTGMDCCNHDTKRDCSLFLNGLLGAKENVKWLVSFVFCKHKVLRKLYLVMLSLVIMLMLFLYIFFM